MKSYNRNKALKSHNRNKGFVLSKVQEQEWPNTFLQKQYSKSNYNNLQTTTFSDMSFSEQNWQSFTALNPMVVKSLKLAGFERPTTIQAQVLQEFKHYYDFLIASQTGSGKTLAFALPVLSDIIDFLKNAALEELPQVLLGLIITPTRELAQQIQQNISQILKHIECNITIVSIIGGMSKQKQLRIIRQRKPHIIIGTPGRIHQFLEDEVFNFEYLKYLIIDEADRMIELGHFVQVDKILTKIFRPKLKQFYQKDFHEITQSIVKKEQAAMKKQNGLFVKQGGKKVRINFDIHSIESDKLFEVPMELFSFIHSDGTIEDNKIKTQDPQKQNVRNIDHQGNLFREPTEQQLYWLNKLKRRIFFVSATLTREFKGQKYSIKRKREEQEDINAKNKNNKKKDKNIRKLKQKQEKKPEEQNQIENIPKLKALLSRVNFSTKPKIIDQSSQLFLPAGLTERISFTDGDNQRISMLVCYLKSLPAGTKVIIFGNTIKLSKRIQFFLDSLGYKCSNLHSHMEQKLRLTKLERFKKSENINILISTDVAARGLDFFVTNVVQYGVPLNGDTYVHRAGRTARANRKGEALILVDRTEGNKWGEINDILNSSVPNRKVDKFCPAKILMDQVQNQVTQLEWIRVNNERQKDARNEKLDEMQADEIGVEPQEQEKRRKYDMDQEQQQMVRHQLKKKVEKIRKQTFQSNPKDGNNIKWKKNKLVLSPEQIMKMM